MIRRRPIPALCLGCLALCLFWLEPARAAEDAAGPGGTDEVEKCVQGNLPDDSSIQTIVLASTDRVGAETRLEAKIYWQKDEQGMSKALLQFSNPPDMRDSSLLVIEREDENDMFMYLPELQKVRRVTTHMMSGSMFGTDFSYEEFERLQGMSEDVSSQRLADSEVGGRAVWVIAARPAPDEGSEYEKVVTFVDREMCVPLRVEFFEKGDKLRKRMDVDASKVLKEGGSYVPRALSMTDLREETTTSMLVESVELDVEIPRKMFSQSQLEKRN